MGTVETKRFEMDPDTAGLWDQVKGDLHRRIGKDLGNGQAIRLVSRLYIDQARRDNAGVNRAIERLKLEDQGYQT